MLECLSCRPRALGLTLSTTQTRYGDAHPTTSTWVVEAGRLEVQVYPQLQSDFNASLAYVRPCLFQKRRGGGEGRQSQEWRCGGVLTYVGGPEPNA